MYSAGVMVHPPCLLISVNPTESRAGNAAKSDAAPRHRTSAVELHVDVEFGNGGDDLGEEPGQRSLLA